MQFIASIIVLASIYAVLGVGFVTIYRASRVLNFAYADIALLLGYFTISLSKYIGGPIFLHLSLSLFFSFILGLTIYWVLIKPMVGEFQLATIILTVALGIIINAGVILIWGGDLGEISFGWRKNISFPGKIYLSGTEIITIVVTVILLLCLGAFYRFSKIGRQMRATAENLLLSAQRGLNIYLIIGITWGIGIFVTGMAGILFGANYGVSLHMGNMVIKGLSVALVGGLDSIPGVIPAAIIISLSEKIVSYYINPRLGDAIPFLIMLIVLLLKPWGLWGTKEEIERV